jgi:glutamate-1-semialdehyde 2,1-aminomutase
MSAILERYLERTPRSAELNARAKDVMPGGDSRSTAWFQPYPPFVAEGRGYELFDVDGNRYVELLNNYTSLIHGHAHPVVVEAIRAQLGRGSAFAAPHELTTRLAEMLCERVPSIERVRFGNSGTEAVMMALRLARAYTGRPLVAKAEGGYHGTWDDVQLSVGRFDGPPEAPSVVAESNGLSPAASAGTVVIPYNDLDASRALLAPLADRLAAIIVEPMLGAGGMVPADPEYLRGIGELARELGALFVLDEVITFRLSPGGVQALYGLDPDLTTIGKIIGGGLPVGAFGGRAEVMDVSDPHRLRYVPHRGTFNGNPATMAGGIAALELLTPDEYERINALGDQLREGIDALGAELGVPLSASGFGSLLNVRLSPEPVRTYRDVAAVDEELTRLLHLAALNEGLFIAPRGLMAISTPMSDATIEEVLAGFRRAVSTVTAETLMHDAALR